MYIRLFVSRCADAGVRPPDRRRSSTLGYGIHLLICLRRARHRYPRDTDDANISANLSYSHSPHFVR